jgi:hypothetical protein
VTALSPLGFVTVMHHAVLLVTKVAPTTSFSLALPRSWLEMTASTGRTSRHVHDVATADDGDCGHAVAIHETRRQLLADGRDVRLRVEPIPGSWQADVCGHLVCGPGVAALGGSAQTVTSSR